MKRNYNKEYQDVRRQAKDLIVKHGTSAKYIIPISFTNYGMSVFSELNKKLYNNTILDYDLGVISETEREIELSTYTLIKNSIDNASIY